MRALATLSALVGSLLVITASPAAAAAELTVTPSEDLVDGQFVDVVASGFAPDAFWGAAVCDVDVASQTQDITGCDLSNTILTNADENGTVQTTFRVRRYITVGGNVVDCAEVGRCIIAGATLGDDLLSAADPDLVATHPLSFDPDAPALPPLDIDLDVAEVSKTAATGTVTCNRTATAYVDFSINQTLRGSSAYGYGFAMVECGADPIPFDVEINSGGRFHAGTAQYFAYASAFDGIEGASDFAEGELRIKNSAKPKAIESNYPGMNLAIAGFDGTTDNGQMSLAVDIDCAVPSTVQVNTSVSQFAGFDSVYGGGYVQDVDCDGPTTVVVPIADQGGEVVGGPAVASVSVYSFDEDDFYFFDYASASGPVVLGGYSTPAPEFPIEPNPDSTITIGTYRDGTLTGTITCPEGLMVSIDVQLIQEHGRTSDYGFGYGGITCTGGEDSLEAMIFTDGLRNGWADVVVSAWGYEITPEGYYSLIYQDYQAGEIRIR